MDTYEKKYKDALDRAKAQWGSVNDETRSWLEGTFPELAESEDERMIRILKEGLEGLTVFNYTPVDKVLAYLEKQKENIEKEYVFRPLSGTDITIAAEQAIRRAMEGDHLVLAFNGWYVPVDKYATTKGLVDSYDTFIEKRKEQKPEERFEEAREKYQVEWSDEDEIKMSVIIRLVEQNSGWPYRAIKEYVNWLKSLRPSWKPSEEQEEPEYYQHFDPDC